MPIMCVMCPGCLIRDSPSPRWNRPPKTGRRGRHLKPGGLVYVSYNAMPGCHTELRLLYAFASTAPGNSIERLKTTLESVREVLAARVPALLESGGLPKIAENPQKNPPHYLVHEYLVGCWRPLWVTEVRAAMAEIGLLPLGSATLTN